MQLVLRNYCFYLHLTHSSFAVWNELRYWYWSKEIYSINL